MENEAANGQAGVLLSVFEEVVDGGFEGSAIGLAAVVLEGLLVERMSEAVGAEMAPFEPRFAVAPKKFGGDEVGKLGMVRSHEEG